MGPIFILLGVKSKQPCVFDCPRKARLDGCESASQVKELCKEFAVSSFNFEENCSAEFLKEENYKAHVLNSTFLNVNSGSVYQFDAKLKFLCDYSKEKIILCKNFKIYEPFPMNPLCKKLPHCLQLLEQENIKCEQT